MKKNEYKKWYLVLGVFAIISMFFGGSLAYWQWTTNESERTSVALTVKEDFRCDADGGGDITSGNKYLVPTDCTNSDYAIQRTITVSPTIFSEQMNVVMDLWLDIKSIDTNLRNSDNFRYALTTTPNSCTRDVVSSGTFKSKSNGSKVQLLDKQTYSDTFTDTFYLYIWLDKKETNLNTRNQDFNFSLNGECINESKENPYYVVYSRPDNSLSFYKENEGVITKGNTYRDKEVTEVYKAYENEHYYKNINVNSSISTVPWYEDKTVINVYKVYIEDEISPIDTSYWFEVFLNVSSLSMQNLNVSNVEKMRYMFHKVGYNNINDFSMNGIDDWNVSNVKDMSNMFAYTAYYATASMHMPSFSEWNTTNLENASRLFYMTMYSRNQNDWEFDVSGWDTSNVKDMSYMFYKTAYEVDSSFSIGDLSGWNTSNVKDMSYMFVETGYDSGALSIGIISGWNTSNVEDMSYMFRGFCNDCSTIVIDDLSGWNVANVRNMAHMFDGYGKSLDVLDISFIGDWDVSNVADMSYMFSEIGFNATTVNIGDLSGWNTSNVKTMKSMFYSAGNHATTFILDGLPNWNTGRVTNMDRMFKYGAQKSTDWNVDLSKWKVSQVTSHIEFNDYATDKVVSPIWSN